MPSDMESTREETPLRSAEEWLRLLLAIAPEERERRLATLGEREPRVAAEVRGLFAAEKDTASVFNAPAPAPGPRSSRRAFAADLQPGDRVGPYVILGILGQGGFGTVYQAEQREPFRRTVALKVIKAGFDTKEIIARFASERQALARMDHPHIARVLDAGSTEAGRPYFVMEHVPGTPVTAFADEHRLTLGQRLQLFTQACDAIAHAHQKAILHRDIKASNVLACFHDGEPTVKVIDFGIAKALTSDRLTDLTFHTAAGKVIGTWATMSPEQAAGSADIDTRTDVYSLGVLLYELLAGVAPFDLKTLPRSSDAELQRIIREVEPPSPGARLTELDAAARERLAEARSLRIAELRQSLAGELAWIPLKAMRKERDRRYGSVLELKEDVENHRAGRALIAGPESRVYRLSKLARRHRAALGSAAAVLLALLVGLGGTTAGLWQARQQAGLARAAEAQATAERLWAEEQRARAEDLAVSLIWRELLATHVRSADRERLLPALQDHLGRALDGTRGSLDIFRGLLPLVGMTPPSATLDGDPAASAAPLSVLPLVFLQVDSAGPWYPLDGVDVLPKPGDSLFVTMLLDRPAELWIDIVDPASGEVLHEEKSGAEPSLIATLKGPAGDGRWRLPEALDGLSVMVGTASLEQGGHHSKAGTASLGILSIPSESQVEVSRLWFENRSR